MVINWPRTKTVDYFLVESAKSRLIALGVSTFVQPVGAAFTHRGSIRKAWNYWLCLNLTAIYLKEQCWKVTFVLVSTPFISRTRVHQSCSSSAWYIQMNIYYGWWSVLLATSYTSLSEKRKPNRFVIDCLCSGVASHLLSRGLGESAISIQGRCTECPCLSWLDNAFKWLFKFS